MENDTFFWLDQSAHMYANGLAPAGSGEAYKMALHAAYMAGGKAMHEHLEQLEQQRGQRAIEFPDN